LHDGWEEGVGRGGEGGTGHGSERSDIKRVKTTKKDELESEKSKKQILHHSTKRRSPQAEHQTTTKGANISSRIALIPTDKRKKKEDA
jgi:hypothetical protein